MFKVLYSLITFGVEPLSPELNLDPADNLFRVKLVCVLLETSAEYFSRGIARTKLDYFFVFFQAYFWSKVSHPLWKDRSDVTAVGIRNYFREVLTSLRPRIRLARNVEEALKARDELVAKLLLKLKPLGDVTNRMGPGDPPSRMGTDMGVIEKEAEDFGRGKENRRNIEGENGGDVKDWERNILGGDRHVEKESAKEGHLDSRRSSDAAVDVGENEMDEELLTEDYSEEMAADSEVNNPSDLPRDDDFVNEFEKMMSDNLQERTRETVGKNKLANMSVPVNFFKSNLKTYDQLTEEKPEHVNFMLMVRSKSNKQSYKPLVVPPSCDLVLNLKSRTEAKKHEMEVVKKLTLNITDRLEEEEYAENEGGTVRNVNHRGGAYKTAPPKGPYTPDAELIFGRQSGKKAYGKYS